MSLLGFSITSYMLFYSFLVTIITRTYEQVFRWDG